MATGTGSTLRRRRLGTELRKLRESAALTIEEVGEHLDCSNAKISRLETGKVPVRRVDVDRMLDLYGCDDTEQREALLEIARESKRKGWWIGYRDILPRPYPGLEAGASWIRNYETVLIPGLLQTEGYMRALMQAPHIRMSDEERDRRVAARLTRQQRLIEEDPPQLWVILDEAVLRRVYGSPEVMREQLDWLLEVTKRPKIALQVLTYGSGPHPGTTGGFVLLDFPDPDHTPVVYTESMVGELYLEDPAETAQHRRAYDHLQAAALSPQDSRQWIAERAREL